jgi:hypothetical protein
VLQDKVPHAGYGEKKKNNGYRRVNKSQFDFSIKDAFKNSKKQPKY